MESRGSGAHRLRSSGVRVAAGIVLSTAVACGGSTQPRNPAASQSQNAGMSEPNPGGRPPAAGNVGPPLAPGDPIPAAVLAGARHWERGGAAGNRVLVVTFTQTRCAAGDPCADTERKLKALQDALIKAPGLTPSVGLLSVSRDPSFDLPGVLRAHADRIGADADVWRFAALPVAEVDAVLARFGAAGPERVTAIVDASGRLAKIYAGSAWTVDEMLGDLRSLVLRADPRVLSSYQAAQTALADDDLGAAKHALARLARAIGEPAVSRLARTAASASDLTAVRAAFKPLSEALVRLPWPSGYQAMYCPMFDANQGATWVQAAGPVRNPYFGQAMLRCGTDLSTGAHADHSARNGGVLFMASDAYHHIEGTYAADGVFRVFVSDNFRRAIRVAPFRARVVLKEELDPRTQEVRELVVFPLRPSADGMTLYARVGAGRVPAELTLKITLDPRAGEERFDFVFADYSKGRGS